MPSSLKSAKVLAPVRVYVLVVVPPENQRLLNVFPPPAKVTPVAEVSVIFMVEVFWFKVRLVVVLVAHTVPVPAKVRVPLPMVSVRVLELLELNNPAVKFFPFASKVPLVSVAVRVLPTIKSSASCQVPPTPLKVIGKSRVCPFVVMVFVPEVALKLKALAPAESIIPETMVKFPDMN